MSFEGERWVSQALPVGLGALQGWVDRSGWERTPYASGHHALRD